MNKDMDMVDDLLPEIRLRDTYRNTCM